MARGRGSQKEIGTENSLFELGIFNEKCTGCRACEFACSFHHKQVFSRKFASLEVCRLERGREISIIRYMEAEKEHFACDYCEGEVEPLCVKYCVVEAITKKQTKGEL